MEYRPKSRKDLNSGSGTVCGVPALPPLVLLPPHHSLAYSGYAVAYAH